MTEKNQQIEQAVHDQYAAVARSELSNDSAAVRKIAAAFGYTEQQLESLPAESNMGLSCGNPVAVAALRAGEVVVDLGCGGGLDVLLAAEQVGPTGKAVGIDMTADMLTRARAAAASQGAENVEFHQALITALPLPDNSVDCVISNCVINLVPDKDQAFREIHRVLKPGGRVAISDIALKQPLPAPVLESLSAYVGCIAGAILIDTYRQGLEAAGFDAVVVSDTGADLNAYAKAGLKASACCSPSDDQSTAPPETTTCCGTSAATSTSEPLHDQLADLLAQFNANDFAASVRVHAMKTATHDKTSSQESVMSHVKIYDRALCCSTGVCGPQVDPVLPRFAADLEWLQGQGHDVERYNLAQQPDAYTTNPTVQQLLASEGIECLPLVVVDDRVVSRGEYPSRHNLALWTNTPLPSPSLPVASNPNECCGGSDCC